MEGFTLGNVMIIITFIVGLIVQYAAIIQKFGERIAKLETKQDQFEKDISHMSRCWREVINKECSTHYISQSNA